MYWVEHNWTKAEEHSHIQVLSAGAGVVGKLKKMYNIVSQY
jgi:hypothetical protein